ncbi:MAG: hypothetical protein WC714_06680 [Candidatus Obscuribacterales bacterium]|jgi:hypothetical protein
MNQRAWNASTNSFLFCRVRQLGLLLGLALGLALTIALALTLTLALTLAPSAYAQFDPDEIERVFQTNDYPKVEAIAQARLQIDPYDVRARYYLATVLLKQKRGGQALLQYEACVKCGGNSPLAQQARKAIDVLHSDAKRANPKYFVRAKPVEKAPANLPSSTLASPNTPNAPNAPNSPDEDSDPATAEAIAQLRKDLNDSIEVKRRRQSQDLELVGEEEAQAMMEAATTLSIQRDELMESVRVEAAAKRAKVYRLYKEEEDNITRAYTLRIEALRNSHKKH